MLYGQVDLVGLAIQGEADCLSRLRTVDVVNELDGGRAYQLVPPCLFACWFVFLLPADRRQSLASAGST